MSTNRSRLAISIYLPILLGGLLGWAVTLPTAPAEPVEPPKVAEVSEMPPPPIPVEALLFPLVLLGSATLVHLFVLRWSQRNTQRSLDYIERLTYHGMDSRDDDIPNPSGELGPALHRLAEKVAQQDRELFELRDRAIDAADRAQAVTTAKSLLLSQISHEIRTPMTAVLGFAELILDPESSDRKRREYAEKIRANSEYLLDLVNNTLDMAKMEAGRMTLEIVRTRPHELVADALGLFTSQAEEKGIELVAEIPEPIPELIRSDPTRLRQILVNLLGNAIKFTPEGSVRLVATYFTNEQNLGRLKFDVIDTGIGLSATECERLFVPFEQADESIARNFGGTGLGLSISLQLAELLGGKIEVTSRKGKGSCFSLTIATGPVDEVPFSAGNTGDEIESSADAAQLSAPRLRGRVLVAEDSDDIRMLIRNVLVAQGVEVTAVENGQQAYDATLEAVRRNTPYDLVLLDQHMPVMTGPDVVRELRNRDYRGRVFAVSASRGDELRQFISAGCDGAFAKPFKRAQLVEFLARHLAVAPGLVELEGRPATETAQGPTEAQGPLESTLADDEAMLPLITEFLRLLTTQMDLVTKACDRGDFAQLSSTVHQIKGSAGTFGYDVISEQAIRIERAIKENRNREEIGLRTRELLKLCERALAAPVPNQQS